MIKFTDFIKVPDEKKTKVKFNMNAGDCKSRHGIYYSKIV